MLVNARALTSGETEVRTEVDGQNWVQPPFAYQAKCLSCLREAHAALPATNRSQVDAILNASNLMAMFEE